MNKIKITPKINEIIYEKILSSEYSPHHYGDCNFINSTIAVVYQKLGMNPILYTGYVETVNPIYEDDGREEWTLKHCWFSINDVIHDFAASQMQEPLDININDSYFIGTNDAYRRVQENEIDTWSNNDLVIEIMEEITLHLKENS